MCKAFSHLLHIGQIIIVFPINQPPLGIYMYIDFKEHFSLAINCFFLIILFFILYWY